ncbi:hypothetical protein BJX96DRAFT_111919 [Aspergillus floccosus]
MIPQRWCGWGDCGRSAAQVIGDCLLCDGHFCRIHRQKPWHQCPAPEEDWESYSAQYGSAETRDIDALCRQIDSTKLCSRASLLRGGIPCTVELSRQHLSSMMGGQNCHVEVTFQDNVKWLARFRVTTTTSPPQDVRDWILRSEVATMNFLQTQTSILTPRVFDWACESDPKNPVGVGYILMEKLDGRPLDWGEANPHQREKVIQQLVNIFLEIEKHPFDAMGSLILSAGNTTELQGLANPSTFRVGEGPLGPFSSCIDGIQSLLGSYLEMIASGEIDTCCPLDTYLVHRFRLDILDALWEDVRTDGPFFLKHPDDKGDHILVNDTFDIVGLIDWEWTETVPKAQAFCSPCMMWPVAEFYKGSNMLTADELRLAEVFRDKGREDLANCVINGRKAQRFFFGLGTDASYVNTQTFLSLFAGLQEAFCSGNEEWENWKAEALERWKSDGLITRLLGQSETRNKILTCKGNCPRDYEVKLDNVSITGGITLIGKEESMESDAE